MKADLISDPQDKEKISQQFVIIETYRDFLEWLFEKSGELDYTSLNEQWEKFEEEVLTIETP